jgi:predicted HicB family RNase H-like nuclease
VLDARSATAASWLKFSTQENQEPQGRARRRRPSRLTEVVPVRFPAELLEEIRRHADADDRSLSAWIRRAVEHELRRPA